MYKRERLKTKKVLVTGANGFIGSHLCEILLKKRYIVIGLVYGDKKNIEHLKKNKNFQMVRGNITNFLQIFRILKREKPQAVFHTAALLPSNKKNENPLLFFEVNTKGTLHLLEACHRSNVKDIVFSSSMSIYGRDIQHLPVDERHPANPADFYGLSKLQAEEIGKLYAQKYNLNIIILRYAGVYGPKREEGVVATFVKNAFKNKTLEILSDTSWDIIHVEDVVRANIKALEKVGKLKSEIINIGSGKETHIKNLAKKIIKITGSKSKIKIKKTLPRFRFFFDIRKAKKLLDFKPLSLQKRLSQYIKDLKRGLSN